MVWGGSKEIHSNRAVEQVAGAARLITKVGIRGLQVVFESSHVNPQLNHQQLFVGQPIACEFLVR
jgi:hypothetical protein